MTYDKNSVLMSVQSECIEQGLRHLEVKGIFIRENALFLSVSYLDRENKWHSRNLWRAIPVIDGYDFFYEQ